jgi:CRISPR-associated protein Cmr2
MSLYFHFTLGPIQGFVAQARRTRDFWAGSFILSWLSAVAMKAVLEQNKSNEIVFPKADETFLRALEQGNTGPKQGSVPNRFMASVGDPFDPAQVINTVKAAWSTLTDIIWQGDLDPISRANPQHREIWDRQIKGFWEISWVITDRPEASDLLDRRKNWRSHLPPPEPGVKCMMMDGWQELSGVSTPHGEALSEFWETVRNKGKIGMASDLREGEHLCALAFVKRRFVRYFHQLQADMPNGWTLTGWTLPHGVPSVAYMAAAPWLAQALEWAEPKVLWHFHDTTLKLTEGYPEYDSNIRCIEEALDKCRHRSSWKWVALDGNVFFDHALENKNIYPEEAKARAVQKALKDLRDKTELKPVSPFYAILLMDGDSLGKHMSNPDKQPVISQALNKFTDRVPYIVHKHSGFLVYAGGDDVLAILPLEYALPCAAALRAHYHTCFENTSVPSTLSGAIEYAHVKMPLTRVLLDAHQLLDEVAKDSRGRNAIAVRVWKPGGLTIEWAMPWEIALDSEGKVIIQQLAEEFQKMETETPFSSKFFYKIGERFDLLNPPVEGGERILIEEQALKLMAAEYLSSGVNEKRKPKFTLDKAQEKIRPLLEQCRPVVRKESELKTSDKLEADGALLVRFLAQKGVER